MSQEQVLMRLEVLKGEILTDLNTFFRKKVQLKDEIDDNEIQIHFKRGMMEGFGKSQEIIKQLMADQKLEDVKAKKNLPNESPTVKGGDSENKEQTEIIKAALKRNP